MSDFVWNSWGVSVIGPSHLKTGIPNQDSWMARRYSWGNVIVVSDGLGSKPYSDCGSKAACLAVFEAAKSYQKNKQANIDVIPRLVHANWLVKVGPLPPSDCAATCLFAIQIEEDIILGRLGDGMIVVYCESEKDCFILSDDKQDSFSNYTYSLHSEFRPEHWEIATVKSARCMAIVLCTDGISDDLLPEKQLDFAAELYNAYRDVSCQKRTRDVRAWLNNWPVPGHSDDKTIACLFKQGDVI
jgi:serine/threonine protein phosphatase PrpC